MSALHLLRSVTTSLRQGDNVVYAHTHWVGVFHRPVNRIITDSAYPAITIKNRKSIKSNILNASLFSTQFVMTTECRPARLHLIVPATLICCIGSLFATINHTRSIKTVSVLGSQLQQPA